MAKLTPIKDICAELEISRRTFHRYQMASDFPPSTTVKKYIPATYRRPGSNQTKPIAKNVYLKCYSLSDVIEWLQDYGHWDYAMNSIERSNRPFFKTLTTDTQS